MHSARSQELLNPTDERKNASELAEAPLPYAMYSLSTAGWRKRKESADPRRNGGAAVEHTAVVPLGPSGRISAGMLARALLNR